MLNVPDQSIWGAQSVYLRCLMGLVRFLIVPVRPTIIPASCPISPAKVPNEVRQGGSNAYRYGLQWKANCPEMHRERLGHVRRHAWRKNESLKEPPSIQTERRAVRSELHQLPSAAAALTWSCQGTPAPPIPVSPSCCHIHWSPSPAKALPIPRPHFAATALTPMPSQGTPALTAPNTPHVALLALPKHTSSTNI